MGMLSEEQVLERASQALVFLIYPSDPRVEKIFYEMRWWWLHAG